MTRITGNCVVESTSWSSDAILTKTCSSGIRTGGGCEREGNAYDTHTYPSDPNSWTCAGGYPNNKIKAYVVCCS